MAKVRKNNNINNFFEVIRTEKAEKRGHVKVYVKFEGSEKIYRYIRKMYDDHTVIISGMRIKYNRRLQVVEMKKAYDLKSDRKRVGNDENKPEESQKIEFEPVPDEFEEEKEEEPELNTEPEPEDEAEEAESEEIQETEEKWDGNHKEYETILECIRNDIPVYLTGPAGSGKNYTIKKIACELGLDFYFTNSVQQEYKITGFIDAGGKYHETEFYKAFTQGGLFFLDELDASIPEVLVLLNAAIANRYFEFPNGRVDAHENFRVIAAGNTIGKGADLQYTGRMVLDSATLDRFVIIEFNYDERIELKLAENDTELVEFIHELRRNSDVMDLNMIFSYRCIEYIVKLRKTNLTLEKVLEIAIFKGLSKETIKMFSFDKNSQYSAAAAKVAA